MTVRILILALMVSSIAVGQESDSAVARKIFTEALTKGQSYEMLEYLCTRIGSRLSGSPQAAAAVEWSKQQMEKYGFDKVSLQEVMVPHWVRGASEYAVIVNSKAIGSREVPVLALGGSVATPPGGITANVVEVQNFEELEKLGKKAIQGKIVFYNRPLDPTLINTGSAYGGAVDQRHDGAKFAARYGAVAAIVRSMTTLHDDVPHTGSMGYDSVGTKIPAAAISTNAADLLSSLLKADSDVQFHLELHCETLPDIKSYNVIGEIKGSEFPDEIVLVGGHLDSWDVGHGAHDDGGGCVQSIEVLRLFKALGIKPKRTLRAVMFMNEENGMNGAKEYAAQAKAKGEKHIVAIESDAGVFTPRGFGIYSEGDGLAKIQKWRPIFEDYNVYQIEKGWGGADINKLKDQGTVLVGFRPDTQRYFDLHHTNSDTFDKVNKRELELGAATMAVLVYLLSEYGL
ncbi:MAG TPA: peptidase M28 family protein [Rhodospirillales bacterium]|nr:peptidase M28 family protein [Flavobacteriales bacterium]HIB20163.1 peptidase M28 family protein [Rhodospirillales bacterium]HIO73082.1 peptidase M28 family protein [Flavobacteriales bacterium]